jgi:hypothetical protein
MSNQNRPRSPSRTSAIAVALLTLVCFAPPALAAGGWAAGAVEGTALKLVDERWQELALGEAILARDIVRTLRSGHVDISYDGGTIALGPDTTLRFTPPTGSSRGAVLEQFSGRVTIAITARGEAVTVSTPKLLAVTEGGTMSVTVADSGVKVSTSAASATVTFLATGAQLLVGEGETVAISAADRVVLSGADGETIAALDLADVTTTTAATAKANNGEGNANGVGNGNVNAGGNGNPGGNGNGNPGGNGNGNPGGNGDGGDNGKGKEK